MPYFGIIVELISQLVKLAQDTLNIFANISELRFRHLCSYRQARTGLREGRASFRWAGPKIGQCSQMQNNLSKKGFVSFITLIPEISQKIKKYFRDPEKCGRKLSQEIEETAWN